MRILIIFILFLSLYQTNLYANIDNEKKFNPKYLSKYFSGLVSFDNQEFEKSYRFFNSSKTLISKHNQFLKAYIFTLIANNKFSYAINKVKLSRNKEYSNFFEGELLLILDSIKRKKFKQASKFLKNLSNYKDQGTYQFIIFETLKSYNDLFISKKFKKNTDFGRISEINDAFQNCYLGTPLTQIYFEKLINTSEDYSRYKYFYLQYLINNNELNLAIETSSNINHLESNLLLLQAKTWIDKKNFNKFNENFLCNNEDNLLSEFFFLISNLYSTDENYTLSEFYLKISNYLNPNFYFNTILEVDNLYVNEQYIKAQNTLDKLPDNAEVYSWYKIRKKTQILSKIESKKKSQSYIDAELKKIDKPSLKILYDAANIYKSLKNYNKAIEFYTAVLLNLKKDSEVRSDVLYRRGGSYERMNDYKKSDQDFFEALKINPEAPHVLNYLAYSWLERDYKINEAMIMLKKAYQLRKEDPYIIDSIGWAYYLIGDFINAEKLIIQAVMLMPDDPIVNDHYADILWKLDRKIQARYFWQYVLKLDETSDEMKKEVSRKILNGLSNI